MIDFISQNKPLGVLLAKAFIGKDNLVDLIRKDEELSKQLADIGYTIKLSPEASTSIKSTIASEQEEIRKKIERVQQTAEIFAGILSQNLRHLAEKSRENTEVLYTIVQIIFLWDEQTDWEDYSQSGGDVTKIRESIFYRAACQLMEDITDEELQTLDKCVPNTKKLDTVLTALQLTSEPDTFKSENYLSLLQILQKNELSHFDILFFLLSLESALFIKFAENLIWTNDKKDLSPIKSIVDLKDGIRQVKRIFVLDEDQLETGLSQFSENLIMKVGFDIFDNK